MTKIEFTNEAKTLTDHFPILREVATAENWAVWYEDFQNWPTRLFQIATRLVCKTVPQWNKGMNLTGVIAQVAPEARKIYHEERERHRIRDDRNLLPEEATSPEEAKENLAKMRELVSGVKSRMGCDGL